MTRHRWLLTSLSISTAGRVPSYFSSSCPLSSYCPPSRHPACHRAPARYPAPTHRPAILPAIELLPAILPAIAVPGLLPFSSHLIVLVEVMRVEEVSSSEVGSSGKVSLLESSASRCRGRCCQGGLWVLAIKSGSWACYQVGFLGVLSRRAPSSRVPSRRVRDLGGSSKLWRRQCTAIFSGVAGR